MIRSHTAALKIRNLLDKTSLSRSQIYLMEQRAEFPSRIIAFDKKFCLWNAVLVCDWMQARLDARNASSRYPHVTEIELADRFIDANELAELVPLDRETILAEERAGRFPCRVRISATRIAWLEREVRLWLLNHSSSLS